MKKAVLKRAVRIAAVVCARAGLCAAGEEQVCGGGAPERRCARCIRSWFLEKAAEELRTEGVL